MAREMYLIKHLIRMFLVLTDCRLHPVPRPNSTRSAARRTPYMCGMCKTHRWTCPELRVPTYLFVMYISNFLILIFILIFYIFYIYISKFGFEHECTKNRKH
jgi:hypothetical protein